METLADITNGREHMSRGGAFDGFGFGFEHLREIYGGGKTSLNEHGVCIVGVLLWSIYRCILLHGRELEGVF